MWSMCLCGGRGGGRHTDRHAQRRQVTCDTRADRDINKRRKTEGVGDGVVDSSTRFPRLRFLPCNLWWLDETVGAVPTFTGGNRRKFFPLGTVGGALPGPV